MLFDEIEKEPYDEIAISLRYQKALAAGERISSCALAATLLSTGADVTATFLASATASIPAGTATGGSTTEIINTGIDHGAQGFEVGDYVVNHAHGWMAQIVAIKKTTNPNDTLVVKPQAVATANGQAYSAAKAVASIKSGTDGQRVSVRFRAITNLAHKFEDEILVNVKDH
jgi:hypothetical protein